MQEYKNTRDYFSRTSPSSPKYYKYKIKILKIKILKYQ